MNVKTLNDYRNIVNFMSEVEGETEVHMNLFLELLEKAEKLHAENLWLYGKLNIISDVLDEGREELRKK